MNFTFKMITYLVITTLMLVALILDHADSKNAMYIEMEAAEAILKAPPAGYITSELQEQIKENLARTRGFDASDIEITGDVTVEERKVRGSASEDIELYISYPRKIYIFFGGMVKSNYTAYRQIKTEYTVN
ncbi:hypothetical protein [Cohnella sp. AR92]|uniref:hypothetical protein n=1 Tax=Cohnella sp. AR92 TaxID=648716 RepID=UPI000F8CCFEB|nr:hypothetical protein [Cohnella sp. AR92]RUS44942.1 hypothetical protein ELR57_22055 [Cohnella sp. AR92]